MGLREECGVVGVWNCEDASTLSYLGLYALQHRGQEAAGIVSLDDSGTMLCYKQQGLVGDIFSKEILHSLKGRAAIGHNRYSTHGGKQLANAQPFQFSLPQGPVALGHNGNITNAEILKKELQEGGSIFHSTSDTEVLMHLVARSRKGSIEEKLLDSFSKVHGAYSLVILTHEKLIAVRDPLGFRPLVLGKKGDGYIVASETCALDLVDATFVREIAPGEMLSIDDSGLHSTRFESHTTLNQPVERKGFCSFETIYFSRPDSRVFGDLVYEKRILLGEELVYEEDRPPKDFADVVIAVPDSGVPMAMGYARASGLAYEIGLVRNHYIGRTFIEPTQSIRDFGVKLKLNPVETVLKGKRVVVVDDSLVRGTTSTKILRMLKNAGAKEIHMRISSPPITGSCYFGVDTPSRKHLLAANNSIEEMCAFVGATSLKFLSQKGLAKVLGDNKSTQNFCYGCFGHGYPEKTFAS